MMERFADCYAAHGGRIDRFGTIRLLLKSVSEIEAAEKRRGTSLDYGWRIYSPLLQKYGLVAGQYRARVSGDTFEVADSSGTIVEVIAGKDCESTQYCGSSRVLPSGYLVTMGEHEAFTAERIEMAAAGKTPSYCDNSDFVRVAPEFAGQEFMQIRLGRGRCIAFKLTGEQVPCTIDQPLAFKRWGRQLPQPDDWDPKLW